MVWKEILAIFKSVEYYRKNVDISVKKNSFALEITLKIDLITNEH